MDTFFFVLSKLLFFVLNPAVWIAMLLATILLVKNSRIRKKLILFTAISYLLLSNVAIQSVFMRWWEVKSLPADSVKKVYTYAVVLGGMSDQDKRNGKLVIERSIDRIIQAVILYNQGKVKKIIVTGGSGELLNQGQKESMLIKDFCIKLGVKDSDILIETESRNTYENAIFTKRLIPYEKEKVLLITSAFHMRRSAAVFAKAGYKFDTLATDPFVTRPAIDDYFLPNARALEGWQSLLKEMVGYLVYGLVGYL